MLYNTRFWLYFLGEISWCSFLRFLQLCTLPLHKKVRGAQNLDFFPTGCISETGRTIQMSAMATYSMGSHTEKFGCQESKKFCCQKIQKVGVWCQEFSGNAGVSCTAAAPSNAHQLLLPRVWPLAHFSRSSSDLVQPTKPSNHSAGSILKWFLNIHLYTFIYH